MMVIDNIVDDFEALRAQCDALPYAPVVSPGDGIEYDGICQEVPESVKDEIIRKLEGILNYPIVNPQWFVRLTTEEMGVKHWVHHDKVLGDFALTVYLTRPEHCQGGLVFVRHRETESEHELDEETWRRDCNSPQAWELTDAVEMRSNRGVLFDAHRLHAASWPPGFGSSPKDARVVLSCFFKLGACAPRPGTVDDVPAVLSLAQEFWPHAWFGDEPFSVQAATDVLTRSAEQGLLAVLQVGDKLGGFAFGLKNTLLATDAVCAGQELAWWVSPQHRGKNNGVRLLSQLENQAKAAGVKHWMMAYMEVSMPAKVAAMYESMGYEKVETFYRRVLS
jgi:GNAT superfamily N-acetyltransferase